MPKEQKTDKKTYEKKTKNKQRDTDMIIDDNDYPLYTSYMCQPPTLEDYKKFMW